MTIKTKDELMEAAEAYIEASQSVKAAQEVLSRARDAIIPAFNKLCRADEDGNRTLDFGPTKIMLVPSRKVDETALKAKLGSDATRFMERHLAIALHTIQHRMGVNKAKDIADDIKAVLDEHLSGEPTLLRNAVKTIKEFDKNSALASLSSEDQKEVKIEVTQTLRPYPERQGFRAKVTAALEWLNMRKDK